jgi:hypothetical protein
MTCENCGELEVGQEYRYFETFLKILCNDCHNKFIIKFRQKPEYRRLYELNVLQGITKSVIDGIAMNYDSELLRFHTDKAIEYDLESLDLNVKLAIMAIEYFKQN